MDMILNENVSLFSERYVVGTHWNYLIFMFQCNEQVEMNSFFV